jgi:hypothetical protein
MRSQTHGTKSSVPWRVIVSLITLVVVATALLSCGKETTFSPEPAAHRLLNELEKWPDDYYWLIETGVASRVMGIRAGGESIEESLKRVDKLVSQVKADWSNIAKLDTAVKLIDYFRQHNLEPIAEAIEKTLSQNKAREPAGEFHAQLQALAIKRGLISSYREVQKELAG